MTTKLLRKPEHSSSVTNGTALFLEPVDQRSSYSRRWHDIQARFISDLGGWDQVTEGQASLVRRITTLSVSLEQIEARFAQSAQLDPELASLYATLANSLRRLISDIGLERRQVDVTNLSKVLAAMPPPSKRASAGNSNA